MKTLRGNILWAAAATALSLVIAACGEDPAGSNGRLGSAAYDGPTAPEGSAVVGAVLLMSNAASGNEILVYSRDNDGTVTPAGAVSTGGLGTGGGLGNQASLSLSDDSARLFVVNAGSNDLSVLAVDGLGLSLIGAPVPSGGEQPISVTVHDDLLYVLNAGGAGNIAGFRIGEDGSLSAIPNSVRPLSSAASGPAEIQFTPNGKALVVTEKATNAISAYVVGPDGTTTGPNTFPAVGNTPFGFSFNQRGDLVVSNAGGGSGGSTASSYRVEADGTVDLISGPVPTTQSAACWIVMSQNGQFAFTTNTGSGTLSRLDIGPGGTLGLAEAVAGDTGPGSLPQDAAFTPGGRFLYVRNNAGTIGAFRLDGNGSLTHLGNFGSLPGGANGMVAL